MGELGPHLNEQVFVCEFFFVAFFKIVFILLSLAFLFYIPRVLWKILSQRSGLDLESLVESANNYRSLEKIEHKHVYMKYLISNIDQYVDDQRRYDVNRKLNRMKSLLLLILPVSNFAINTQPNCNQ